MLSEPRGPPVGAAARALEERHDELKMTNNDVLRTLRYALDLDDTAVLALFALADIKLSWKELDALLKNEDEPGAVVLSDPLLGRLLDGLVIKNRGKREPAPGRHPEPLAALSNNRILQALRIALELKDTDMLAILSQGGLAMSKSELAALFRREGHRNYQPCGDQVLRNFLRGLGIWQRSGRPLSS
jgi:uncharacterized protein YehS (DUF1456 family)